MTRRQEIICILALILWAVQCGNWHLEAKIAKADALAELQYGGARVIEVSATLKKIGAIG